MGMPVEKQSTILRDDMGTMLKEILQALCAQTGWCYAVLWRLQRRNRMVLTWEDGFYQPVVARGAERNLHGVKRDIEGQGSWIGDVNTGEDSLRMAVLKMSYHVFYLGEGVIGKAAITGKHQWVFAGGDNGVLNGIGSGQTLVRPRMEKYPAGWDSQFAAGIKTIAVVAVAQGVVQLGSMETIMEDLGMVAHIRSLFLKLQDSSGLVVSNHDPEMTFFVKLLNFVQMNSEMEVPIGLSPQRPGADFLQLATCTQAGSRHHSVVPVEGLLRGGRHNWLPSCCSQQEKETKAEFPGSAMMQKAFAVPSLGPALAPDWMFSRLSKSSGLQEESAVPAIQDTVSPKAAPEGVDETFTDACLSSLEHCVETPVSKNQEPRLEKSPQSVDNDEVASKTCRKRSRLCENVRPRPKDRQQIQDRVRELREIIPESSKCSIDSLLERTVRHIHFLDNVTQLRDCNRRKKSKDGTGTEVKSHELPQSAWNLDGHSCNPLIVEDLSYPRHMLVEILFEKKSLLAGIAENIRGLGLTILKGVMEVKKDKVRACFVVEAAKDTHRLEVFWSLAHFVEQMGKSTSSSGGECPLGPEMLEENGP